MPAWLGTVHVAFVIDAFSRRVIGWHAATSMTTPLVLDGLEHALFTRAQEGVTDLTGLVAYSDAGSQGEINRSSQPPVMEVWRVVNEEGVLGSSTAGCGPGGPAPVALSGASAAGPCGGA